MSADRYDVARHYRRAAHRHSVRAKACTTRPELLAVLDRMTSCYEAAEDLDPCDPSDQDVPSWVSDPDG